ncbi:MAG: hypothetical protein LQ346_005849 [Caloplaca aetnensis]|nr:MAG: hypothetical protein LQ346_005849 [Caloplaca aetnensis]
MVDYQRLYVSPLDPQLLPTVLSGPLRESATNITYHTLQAFPEKRYGYVDLPTTEADFLRKKLHGFILKGMKMKVEKARPEKVRKGTEDGDEVGKEDRNKMGTRGKAKTRKEDGVLPGVELPNDRKVKRGWTDPAVAKGNGAARVKNPRVKESTTTPSAHTDGPECLFKTAIPPNAVGNGSGTASAATKPRKRKRRETERGLVVHEFEKTTKYPSFIKDEISAKKKELASSYVEGKGWVDEAGNLIEAETGSRRTRSKVTKPAVDGIDMAKVQIGNVKATLSHPGGRQKRAKGEGPAVSDKTSSSGSSASESEDKSLEDGEEDKALEKEVDTEQVRALSITRSSPTPPLEGTKEVHPLEVLFKRPRNAASQTPQKPSLEVKTGFSFFGPDAEQNDPAPLVIPQTPFTQQDFQERRLRSAAPTPDTAAPSKTTFGRVWSQESRLGDSVSDEAEDDTEVTPTAPKDLVETEDNDQAKESEFARWFYEHRGETNRAWKRRRREAAKEKRQKENKRR